MATRSRRMAARLWVAINNRHLIHSDIGLIGVLLHDVAHVAERVAAVSVAHAAEPQVSVDIALVFHFAAPASVAPIEAYSPARPKFRALPNNDLLATPSSSVEIAGREWVDSSMDVRTSYAHYSIPASLDQRRNRSSERGHNKPNPGYSKPTYTNRPPMGATTSHSKKTDLH